MSRNISAGYIIEHPLNQPSRGRVGAVEPHRYLPLQPLCGQGPAAGENLPADHASCPDKHGSGPGHPRVHVQGIGVVLMFAAAEQLFRRVLSQPLVRVTGASLLSSNHCALLT